MTIERTEDYRRVKAITSENLMGDEEAFDLIISHDFIYLMEVEDGKDVGTWCFEPVKNDRFYMHSCTTPECRGKKAVDAGLRAIGWLYENTDADVILAPIPAELRHAQLIPRVAGLQYEGRNDFDVKFYRCDRDLYAKIRRN